jgi:pimeloyl-ACP methyl ester carboxylesterase
MVYTGRYVKVDGMRLFYLEWGEPGAPVMVLLHGIGDNAHIWDIFANSLHPAWRIIALDQRGHGLSDWAVPPAYGCDEYVHDLEEVIRILDLENVVLVGHSMGALHATAYAARHSAMVAALVHADIEPCPPEWNKKYLRGLYHTLPEYYGLPEEYVARMKENSPFAEERFLYYYASHALATGGGGNLRCQYDREVLYHFDRYDLSGVLEKISCPTLVMRGAESRVMSSGVAESMTASISNASLVEIPRATHPVHTDSPHGFRDAICKFLNEHGLQGRHPSRIGTATVLPADN